MGIYDKPINDESKVKGAKGLQVVDASVISTLITSLMQACVYALAKHVADIILIFD